VGVFGKIIGEGMGEVWFQKEPEVSKFVGVQIPIDERAVNSGESEILVIKLKVGFDLRGNERM